MSKPTKFTFLVLIGVAVVAGWHIPVQWLGINLPHQNPDKLLPVFGRSSQSSLPGPLASRADTYEAAIELAKAGDKDIVVFQRGSDWNRLAEAMYHEIWQSEDFARAVGDHFILLAVDNQDSVGADPLAPAGRDNKGNIVIPVESSPRAKPMEVLMKLADGSQPPPVSDIDAVASEGKATFARRDDGSFVVDKSAPNPAQDVITLKLNPGISGKLLRLDFPLDPNLPGNGPGRATNGNFAVNEIEASLAGKPIKFKAVWASYSDNSHHAASMIDGIIDKPDLAWLGAGNQHKPRTVMLVLDQPVSAGGNLVVRISSKTQWGQHVPGSFRACIIDDAKLEDMVSRVSMSQMTLAGNSKFTWWDKSFCPRVAMVDSKGRGVACFNNPRLDLTMDSLVERIHRMRETRLNRDALWAKADKATGTDRAELLRQGLALMSTEIGCTVSHAWKGNDKCYQWIWDEVAKLDPKDDSWILRWLNTSPDSRGGFAGMEDVGKLTKDGKYDEALALIDRTLADTRMKRFTVDHRQRLMLMKFHVYAQWDGATKQAGKHKEEMVDIERAIAALDSTTYLGIGALGDIVRHWQVPEPRSVTYGWGQVQVKAGTNDWDFDMGVDLRFNQPGRYKIRIKHNAGASTLKLAGISLKDGDSVLASSIPMAPRNEIGPGKLIELEWRIKPDGWRADRKLHLEMQVVAEPGKTDCGAIFEIDPQLDEVEFSGAIPARRDMIAEQRALAEKIMASGPADSIGSALADSLARHEWIRACGAGALDEIQCLPGGTTIISMLLDDPRWLETIMTSSPPAESMAQTTDNLRVLNLCGGDMENPVYRKLMTAIALSARKMNSFRLAESLRYTWNARQNLLLHAGFDQLTVREMRHAIVLGIPEADYDFLVNDRQCASAGYLGACWAVSYRLNNDFGTSIHGGGYHEPWNWCWTGWRVARQVGGVCGTLSTFGSMTAKAHGVPSFPVGQPGHCAYVVRQGMDWPVGYSVTWPTSCSAPGWEGTGYSSMARYYEPAMAAHDKVLNANRWLWLARVQASANPSMARVMPGLGYSQYRLPNGSLPDFTKLTAEKSGTTDIISARAIMPTCSENVGLVWIGKIDIPVAGSFIVSCQADDIGRIIIDGKEVIRSTSSRVEKVVPLGAGSHDLRVEYVQGTSTYYFAMGIQYAYQPGEWCQTARKAIVENPADFGVWLDYVKLLETSVAVPPQQWADLARDAAKNFAVCNEAAWALVMRCLDKSLPSMNPRERVDLLAGINAILKQEFWERPEYYPMAGVFNWQADRVGDPEQAVGLFSRLLSTYYNENPNNSWIFGQVLAWGTTRFGSNKAVSVAYAKAMESFFAAQGDAADKKQMTTSINANIRKASESGDFPGYLMWSDMADRFLPELAPADVHLTPNNIKSHPAIQPFPGSLISPAGMLQSSSASGNDRPRSYRAIQSDAGFGGYVDTNAEPKPWVQIQLPGNSEVTGVILVDRYEFTDAKNKGQQAELAAILPFKISVSPDGKVWTEVATVTAPAADKTYRIDLAGKANIAKFVRVEHFPDPRADPKSPHGRIHLRHFLVYGKKLY